MVHPQPVRIMQNDAVAGFAESKTLPLIARIAHEAASLMHNQQVQKTAPYLLSGAALLAPRFALAEETLLAESSPAWTAESKSTMLADKVAEAAKVTAQDASASLNGKNIADISRIDPSDLHLPAIELTEARPLVPAGSTIPEFDANGVLPVGIYKVGWDEFAARFVYGTRRKELSAGMLDVLHQLKDAGGRVALVGGSFVSTKEFPGDFDMVWMREGVRENEIDRELLNKALPGKSKYGGHVLMEGREVGVLDLNAPTPGEAFTFMTPENLIRSTRDGKRFGIVAIDLTKELPPRVAFKYFSIKEQ